MDRYSKYLDWESHTNPLFDFYWSSRTFLFLARVWLYYLIFQHHYSKALD